MAAAIAHAASYLSLHVRSKPASSNCTSICPMRLPQALTGGLVLYVVAELLTQKERRDIKMLDDQMSQDGINDGFNEDYSKFFYQDLVFDVEISKRRKTLGVVFNRQDCRFILKIGAHMFNVCDKKGLKDIAQCLIRNNAENFHRLLRDNVQFKEMPKQTSINPYAQDDIIYLHGLPYRIEIEYEMRPGLFAAGKKSQDSVEIVQQPQQLALLMVPQGTSRYAGKFERLYDEGYYRPELLNELPVVITQAAADKHNELRPQYLQAIEEQLQQAQNQLNYDSFNIQRYIRETSDYSKFNYDLSEFSPEDKRGVEEEIRLRTVKGDLLLNVPLLPGLVLPPRQQEYLDSVYLKRVLLEFAWLFALKQDHLYFDTLQRHYSACIKYFSSKLQVDLWEALQQGKLCKNPFFLDADNTFLERFIGIASPFESLDNWFAERWAALAGLFADMSGSRFYTDEVWSSSYGIVNLKLESEIPDNYSIADILDRIKSSRSSVLKRASASNEYAASKGAGAGDKQSEIDQYHNEQDPTDLNLHDSLLRINKELGDIEYEIDEYDDDFYGEDDDSYGDGGGEGTATCSDTALLADADDVPHKADYGKTEKDTVEISSQGMLSSICSEAYKDLLFMSGQKQFADFLNIKYKPLGDATEFVAKVDAKNNNVTLKMLNDSSDGKAKPAPIPEELKFQRKELQRQVMRAWYEAGKYNIDFTDDELWMNMALYPLLKVEHEEMLCQSMVLADKLDLPDLYLTPDIIGSQYWEVTGPMLERLTWNKQNARAVLFKDKTDLEILETLTSPNLDCFEPEINTIRDFKYDVGGDWGFGTPNLADAIYADKPKTFRVTDDVQTDALSKYVADIATHNLHSNVYWWPFGKEDITQPRYRLLPKDRFVYPSCFNLLHSSCAYHYNDNFKAKAELTISSEMKKLTDYLHLGELYFERTVLDKIGKIKQQNYQAAKKMSKGYAHALDHDDQDIDSFDRDDLNKERIGASSEQAQIAKQFMVQFRNQAGVNLDLPALSFTGYAQGTATSTSVPADSIEIECRDAQLQKYVDALRLGKAGTQYSICVELDHPVAENYLQLMYKKYGQQAPKHKVNWAEDSDNQPAPKLHQEVRSSLLLPGMCWTLGAAGEEIDPSEAVICCLDVYFSVDQDVDIEHYERMTGKPLATSVHEKTAKSFGKAEAKLIQESNIYPHSCWKPKYWHRSLVRPGVIKLRIANRKFGAFDSIKEQQYRYDLLMSLCRRSLAYKVLDMVKIFCPVDLKLENQNVPKGITVLELQYIESAELEQRLDYPLWHMIYLILKGLFFRRILILGGMSAQGRCTRSSIRDQLWPYADDIIQVLSISQEMAALPLSFVLATVAHESCHLDVFNHSQQFKRELQAFCPFYLDVDSRWLELKFMQSHSPKRIRHTKLNAVTVGNDKTVTK